MVEGKITFLRTIRRYFVIYEYKSINLNINNMKLELHKEDLLSLSEIVFCQDGYVSFIMAGLSSRGMVWEREIIIRNVLKLFGDQYKVVGIAESELAVDGTTTLTRFETNLPWSMIEELLDDDEFHF